MSLPPGLPPLPKSLSEAAEARNNHNMKQSSPFTSSLLDQQGCGSGNGPSCSRISQTPRQGSLSSTQESHSDRDSMHSRASSSLSAHDTPTSITTLDTQIAILRREMYSLRQLDLSLLSQLWALNESIQGFRTFLQERDEMSPSPTPSNTNSISSDEPDMASFAVLPQPAPLLSVGGSASSASQASTSTSASNSLSAALTGNVSSSGARPQSQSSNGKVYSQLVDERAHPPQREIRTQLQQNGGRIHPQLPSILQQRMRRPPPPPPPTRGISPNKTQDIKRSV